MPTDRPSGWSKGEYGHDDFYLGTYKLSELVGAGSKLTNAAAADPLYKGMTAVYKLEYWIDTTADNNYSGRTLSFDLIVDTIQDGGSF